MPGITGVSTSPGVDGFVAECNEHPGLRMVGATFDEAAQLAWQHEVDEHGAKTMTADDIAALDAVKAKWPQS